MSYTIGYMALPQHEAGLRHYLDTILRTDERLTATNIGLKTSNERALVSQGRSINYSIAMRLADGCLCKLVP